MIIDGDLAIEWKRGDRFLADHRSVSVPIVPHGPRLIKNCVYYLF
jgi:hypothetical protein